MTAALQDAGLAAQTAGGDFTAMGEEATASAGVAASAGEEMSIGLMGVLGPAGLIAAGIGLVGGLVASFIHLGQQGPSAAQQTAQAVQQMSTAFKNMPKTSLTAMLLDLDKLQGQLGSINQQLQHLTPGSNAFSVMSAKATHTRSEILSLAQMMATQSGNVYALATAFGITGTKARALGQEVGITLNSKLDPTQIKVFANQVKQSGTSFNTALLKSHDWASGVAQYAAQVVASQTSANSTLNASTKTAMGLQDIILSHGGAKAMADYVNSIHGGLPAVTADMQQAGLTIPSQYLSLLKQAMTKTGKISMKNLANAVSQATPTVISATGGILAGTQKTMRVWKDLMGANGTKGTLALAQGILSKDKTLSTSATTVLAHAITALTKHQTDGQPIGSALAKGIAAGLLSATSAVSQAAVQIVQNAVNAAKTKGKIKSPSGLTRAELGQPLGLGTALGILDMLPMIKAASHSMTGAALAGRPTSGAALGLGLSPAPGAAINVTFGNIMIQGGSGTPAKTAQAVKAGMKDPIDQLISRLNAGSTRA